MFVHVEVVLTEISSDLHRVASPLRKSCVILIFGHNFVYCCSEWRLRHHTQDLIQDLSEGFSTPLNLETPVVSLTSAAAMVVSSAFVSYAGATSTRSAETIFNPSRPRMMVRSSRVVQPPVSGVPVAGANAGSMESIFTGKTSLMNVGHAID